MGVLTSEQRLKSGISFSLSLLSVCLLCIFPSVEKVFCLFAMLLSTLGDLFLMDFTPFTKRIKGNLFIIGVSAFGVAHLFYILTFSFKLNKIGAEFNFGTAVSLVVAVLTMLMLFAFARTKKTVGVKMIAFGLLYIAILSANMLIAFSYAYKLGGFAYVSAVGAFSFFFSDVVIAFNTVFRLKNSLSNELLIWIPYVIGQLLLIIGA